MTPLPGFEPHITAQEEAAAEERGRELSRMIRNANLPSIDKATGYMLSHSPLFAGSAADPQTKLFTHDDPTF